MKLRNIVLLAFALPFFGLVSCTEEEPAPDVLVGEWKAREFVIQELPDGFTFWTGATQETWFGESEYRFKFNTDNTYKRELFFDGAQDLEEEGTWERTETELELDIEGTKEPFLTYDFDIVMLDEDDFDVSSVQQLNLVSDATLDDYSDTLTRDFTINDLYYLQTEHASSVSATILYKFDNITPAAAPQ
ncbi:MAG: hypothetical protein JXQ90_12375 [Cyclobacteriaceae bacterium]